MIDGPILNYTYCCAVTETVDNIESPMSLVAIPGVQRGRKHFGSSSWPGCLPAPWRGRWRPWCPCGWCPCRGDSASQAESAKGPRTKNNDHNVQHLQKRELNTYATIEVRITFWGIPSHTKPYYTYCTYILSVLSMLLPTDATPQQGP